MRSWIGFLALAAGGVLIVLLLKEPQRAVRLAEQIEINAPEVRRVSADLEEPQETSSDLHSQRTSLADPSVQEAEPSFAEPSEKHEKQVAIRGRVCDVHGEPLSFLNVCWKNEPGTILATSDAAGRFTFETDSTPFSIDWPSRRRGILVAEGGGFVPVGASVVTLHTLQSEHVLISATTRRVGGIVTDSSGSGLAASIDSGCQAQQPFILESFDDKDWVHKVSGKTDSAGRFALEGVPDIEGVMLRASSKGYVATALQIPKGEAELTIVLESLQDARPLVITGVVLLPDRSPAVGARVAYGPEKATTDEEGSFHLPFYWSRPEVALAAGLEGYCSAFLPRFGEVIAAASPLAPPPATLVLGPQSLSITGIVVDAEESPLEGWMVSIVDGTEVSHNTVPIVYAEGLGGALKNKTGKDGTFRVTGLFDRDYVLRAHNPETLVSFETASIAAGDENVRIKVPSDVAFPRVAGRVVSRTGKPIAGVGIYLSLVTQQSGGSKQLERRTEVLSDERGAFELLDVPRNGASLGVTGKAIIPISLDLSTEEDLTDMVIEVSARCDFRVQATGSNETLSVQVLDAAGASLAIYSLRARNFS